MKKISLITIICLLLSFSVWAQNKTQASKTQSSILTAGDYFQTVSATYADIKQYEADIEVEAEKSVMKGHVSFKKPSMLRIDFSDPANQVILYNGSELIIYIPKSSAILRQDVVTDSEKTSVGNIATPQGLALMSRYYSIQYENGPSPEPIDPENPRSEKVFKLVLSRKNNSENFRRMNIAIDPKTNLIRTIHAETNDDRVFAFTFTNYIINEDIPDTRFLYDTPPTAN
ncbi:MAG: outer-membrane lipoprotein carrier protein LolA, partial [Treponemataceae bacterium]|nr:outer-membrane lipoprotein carrier protein LolA [Treponemataceae bacterium]